MRFLQVPEQLKQVPDQVKEVPAHALRAVFAGVGQLLLVTDRLRGRPSGRTPLSRPGKPGPAPEQARTGRPQLVPAATPQAVEGPAAASAPETAAAPAAPPAPEAAAPPAPKPEAAASAPGEAASGPAVPEPVPAAAPADEPPIPNYDELSVASLRARLRGLSADRVRELLAYEKAHARRPAVMAMYERRVAKLEAAEG